MSTSYKITLILSTVGLVLSLYFSDDLGVFFAPICGITFIIACATIAVGIEKLLNVRFDDTRKTHEELMEDAQIYGEYSYTADPSLYDELETKEIEGEIKDIIKDDAWVDDFFKIEKPTEDKS